MSNVDACDSPSPAPGSTTLRFEDYIDNWSYWSAGNRFPVIPPGVIGDIAFAVVDCGAAKETLPALVTFNPSYAISVASGNGCPPGCTGLGVGGWGNSAPGLGLAVVLTSAAPGLVQQLVNLVVTSATQGGYTNVLMDYECHDASPDAALYTQFVQALGAALHAVQSPRTTLTLVMSAANQSYFDLAGIVAGGAVDYFQVMTYDYGMGQSPVTVVANNGIAQSIGYLTTLARTIPVNRLMVGAPLYGLGYQLATGTTLAAVQKGLAAGNLTATGYYQVNGSPQIPDDTIASWIGSWTSPTGGWQLATDTQSPPNVYYFNAATSVLVSAFPPAAMGELASAIRTGFPGLAGVFAWEAFNDMNGTMMQALVNAFTASGGSTSPTP